MNLWLRVRRTRTCAITILAVAVSLFLLGNLYLPLPNLLGGPPLAVPLALLIPLAVGIVVAFGLTMGDPLIEAVASRPIPLFDAIHALSAALLALAACALARTVSGMDVALAAGRNAVGYVGLTLIGRRLLGPHAAPVLPAGFAVMTSLFGSSFDRQPHWWAWLLAPIDDIMSWSITVALLILGIIAILRGCPAK